MSRLRYFYEAGKPWPLFFICTLGPMVVIYGSMCLIFGVPE